MPPDLVQDTWSIRTLIVWCSHYSIILHWHWRMKSLKPFQTILHQLLLLQKPFQVSSSNAINVFWIHWSQRVPLNRGSVPICDCHAAWGATVFQLQGVISHDSLRWKRNVETRTHSAPKNHSLPALEKKPPFSRIPAVWLVHQMREIR